MVLYTHRSEGSAVSRPSSIWLPPPSPRYSPPLPTHSPPGLAPLLPVYLPLWMLVVNHVLAAGCQLVDGLGIVGQGLFQHLMLLHLRLGAQLVLGKGTGAAGGKGQGRRDAA